MTRLILVRHGQTEWNRVEHYRGRADIPLNDTGLAQAEATGRRIAVEWGREVVALYSSPLTRTVQTAEAIGRHLKLPVSPFQGLIDLDMGLWQGLTPEQVQVKWPELYRIWHTSPSEVLFPDGESLAQMQSRAMSGLHELIRRHDDRTIILVSHTDVNRSILLGVLGLGSDSLWTLRQDNCAINVIEAAPTLASSSFTLVSMNDTAHLHAWAGFERDYGGAVHVTSVNDPQSSSDA